MCTPSAAADNNFGALFCGVCGRRRGLEGRYPSIVTPPPLRAHKAVPRYGSRAVTRCPRGRTTRHAWRAEGARLPHMAMGALLNMASRALPTLADARHGGWRAIRRVRHHRRTRRGCDDRMTRARRRLRAPLFGVARTAVPYKHDMTRINPPARRTSSVSASPPRLPPSPPPHIPGSSSNLLAKLSSVTP